MIAGKGRDRNDRLDAVARDGEVDRVRAPRRGIGVEDGLAERAGAAVGRRRDREQAVGDEELGPERRGAGRLGSRLRVVLPWNPGGGVKLEPSSAAFSAMRLPR